MAGLELAQHLRQQELGDGGAGADEQRPGNLAAHLPQACFELGREIEDALGVLQRQRSGGGERDAPVRAVEQARIEMLLELADLEGHRRLGHEQRPRRLGEGEVLRDRVKDLQTTVRHDCATG